MKFMTSLSLWRLRVRRAVPLRTRPPRAGDTTATTLSNKRNGCATRAVGSVTHP